MQQIDNKHVLFTLSAVTGTGKSTVAQQLLQRDQRLKTVVSYTTRPIRPGEEPGASYHFVPLEHFDAMRRQGAFVECANVYKHWYGVAKKDLLNALKLHDVLLVIDWQGAKTISTLYRRVVQICLFPPSVEVLKARLFARDGVSDEVKKRIQQVPDEILHLEHFDYMLVNDRLPDAVEGCMSVIQAERLRGAFQKEQHKALLQALGDPSHYIE